MSADTSSASVAGNPGGEFPRAFYPIIRAIDRFTDVTGKLIAMSMLFLVVTISVRGRHAVRVRRADRLGLRIQLHGQRRGLHARMPDMRC